MKKGGIKLKRNEEWLEEFRGKIIGAYEEYRMDKQLARHIYEVDEDKVGILLKGSGPLRFGKLKIDFDNMQKPTRLIIKRLCSSAPEDGRAVVKILL